MAGAGQVVSQVPELVGWPELVVLVDFVFPWGIEYPVVFLPQGLLPCGVCKWPSFKGFSQMAKFFIFRGFFVDCIESRRCCILF